MCRRGRRVTTGFSRNTIAPARISGGQSTRGPHATRPISATSAATPHGAQLTAPARLIRSPIGRTLPDPVGAGGRSAQPSELLCDHLLDAGEHIGASPFLTEPLDQRDGLDPVTHLVVDVACDGHERGDSGGREVDYATDDLARKRVASRQSVSARFDRRCGRIITRKKNTSN